jgi:hypothetical protein
MARRAPLDSETAAAEDIGRALAKMRSLHDGDAGVIEAVSIGRRAVPALTALMFERDRSGIYQPRCWAAHALSILGAYEVLFDFLREPPEAVDAVERAGDDAVINAAAQYLSALREERVFQLLLSLASRRYWPGAIAGLAAFRRPEAIPLLAGALAEDDCRLLAEPALLGFGEAARPALLQTALHKGAGGGHESETSIRSRKSALLLLMQMGVSSALWPSLRPLMAERDPRLLLPICELCLVAGPEAEWRGAVTKLTHLVETADWRNSADAEECLIRHYPKAETPLSAMLRGMPDTDEAPSRLRSALLRIIDRGVRHAARARRSRRKADKE